MSGENRIEVQDLWFKYRGFGVLKGVDFHFMSGQMVCLLGKNGAGKSTLFRCLMNMIKPQQGQILIAGKELADYQKKELAKQIAYISQAHDITYNFTVFHMVLMGTTASMGTFATPGAKQERQAQEALRLVQIEHLRNRTFLHLSGGEQQLVLIARAIAQQARIIIMDEPCANLDYGNQIYVMELSKRLTRQGYLIIQSTHNPEQALLYADQVLVLGGGRVEACGPPDEIITEGLLEDIYEAKISLYEIGGSGRKGCIPAGVLKNGGKK